MLPPGPPCTRRRRDHPDSAAQPLPLLSPQLTTLALFVEVPPHGSTDGGALATTVVLILPLPWTSPPRPRALGSGQRWTPGGSTRWQADLAVGGRIQPGTSGSSRELRVERLNDAGAWRELQAELRASASNLKQDLYAIIQATDPTRRAELTTNFLDYAARDKDVPQVQEHYGNIVSKKCGLMGQ
ncbi:hypothetical protein EJB05_27765, partial [Eragrostis curvula]